MGGKFPRDAATLRPILERHGLALVSGWYSAHLCRRTEEEDQVIDQLEIDIDEFAIRLMESRPSGPDLRLICVAMKISHNLERIGDEATTVSRRVLELTQEPPLREQVNLPAMAAIALEMLKHALDAFVHPELGQARLVIQRDQKVDALNKQLHADLTRLMAQKPETITRCLNLMVVSKSLERVADHATNIAEEAIYLYEGRDIRHAGKRGALP